MMCKKIRIMCYDYEKKWSYEERRGLHIRTVEVQITPEFKVLRVYIPANRKWYSLENGLENDDYNLWMIWKENVAKVLCGESVGKDSYLYDYKVRGTVTKNDVSRIKLWRLLHEA